jgi:hypothetical protein
MAVTLAEPTVLAAAKDTLYPGIDTSSDQYAVTETQFTQSTWDGWTVPDTIRNRLAPYNTIRLAAGEPDLLAVGMPAIDVLNGDAATTPVTTIEGKATIRIRAPRTSLAVSPKRMRAFRSQPRVCRCAGPSITDAARAQARNLNVGVIAVEDT